MRKGEVLDKGILKKIFAFGIVLLEHEAVQGSLSFRRYDSTEVLLASSEIEELLCSRNCYHRD